MQQYFIVAALGLVALGAVLFPILAGRARYASRAEMEADLARYREALAAGTLCSRCQAANPVGSRFCADCGTDLTAGD